MGGFGTNAGGPIGTASYRHGPVATQLTLPHSIQIDGQAGRRGLIPRMPAGDRLLAGIDSLLKADYSDYVRATEQGVPVDGQARLAVSLHPAAPPVVFTADDAGHVTVAAETAAGGPGYHRFVGRALGRIGDEVGIEWVKDGLDRFAFADRAVGRAGLYRLARSHARSRLARRCGAGLAVSSACPTGLASPSRGRSRRRSVRDPRTG